jgi:dihydropteroate synthase
MLNDVWGLRFDPRLARVALHASVPLVFMHNRTQPADPAYQHLPGPHKGPVYGDIIAEIRAELEASLQQAQVSGLPRWLLIADPGIGFGKTLEQHLELIRRLGEFKPWGYPMLFGASRKGFIGKLLDNLPPEERDEGTLATCILAIARGADILRVHNVRAMSRAARVADAIVRS